MTDTALFIHSTGTGPFMWKRLAASLPPSLQAVTPVNRGYAPDDVWPLDQRFDIAMDVAHLKQQIPAATTGLHLVAHSYGGLLALNLARDESLPIQSIWLYEPVFFGSMRLIQDQLEPAAQAEVQALYDEPDFIHREDQGGDDTWLAHFVDYWSAPGVWASMPDKVKAMNRAVGHKMFHEVRAIALNHQPLAEFRTQVPMTIVYGEHTRAPARAMSEHLAQVNPHAQLEVAAGLGHMSVITQADMVATSLQNHWARVLS